MIPAAGMLAAWAAAPMLMLVDGRRRWVGCAAVAALAVSFLATGVLAGFVIADGPRTLTAGDWPPGVGIVFRADALGVLFAALSAGVLLVALAYEVAAGVRSPRFPAVVMFLTAGLTGLFLTGDVFNFYVFFELSMISAYVLSTYGAEARQVGSAFIFAVVNLLGSFLFLIGVAAIYSVTGTLEMTEVAARLSEVESNAPQVIAAVLFVAFAVKLGLFPFHLWLPAVYANATPGVAAILSGALANIGSYGVLRFGAEILPAQLERGAIVLIVLGTASIVYGALQAVSRRAAGDVLAYSAIGQVGYVLVAVAIGGPVGYAAAILYALVNALNKALLFISSQIRGWLVGAAFAVGALSVAGLPPSAGFLGKLVLFQTGLQAQSVAGTVGLVALIFLGGALSFVYMLQIYQHDFWRGERSHGSSPAPMRALAAGLAVLILALGIWPEGLLVVSEEAAAVLIGGPG